MLKACFQRHIVKKYPRRSCYRNRVDIVEVSCLKAKLEVGLDTQRAKLIEVSYSKSLSAGAKHRGLAGQHVLQHSDHEYPCSSCSGRIDLVKVVDSVYVVRPALLCHPEQEPRISGGWTRVSQTERCNCRRTWIEPCTSSVSSSGVMQAWLFRNEIPFSWGRCRYRFR